MISPRLTAAAWDYQRLEDIPVVSQVRSPHASGVIQMGSCVLSVYQAGDSR